MLDSIIAIAKHAPTSMSKSDWYQENEFRQGLKEAGFVEGQNRTDFMRQEICQRFASSHSLRGFLIAAE